MEVVSEGVLKVVLGFPSPWGGVLEVVLEVVLEIQGVLQGVLPGVLWVVL